MGFGYDGHDMGMATYIWSPVRISQPVQRQQSHDSPYLAQGVPSQCSDANQKFLKDLANESLQRGVTESKANYAFEALDGYPSQKFFQDGGNQKQEDGSDNRSVENNSSRDCQHEFEGKQVERFPHPEKPEGNKRAEKGKWKDVVDNDGKDAEKRKGKMDEFEPDNEPEYRDGDKTKEEQTGEEVKLNELGSSKIDMPEQMDSLKEEVMEKWQMEDQKGDADWEEVDATKEQQETWTDEAVDGESTDSENESNLVEQEQDADLEEVEATKKHQETWTDEALNEEPTDVEEQADTEDAKITETGSKERVATDSQAKRKEEKKRRSPWREVSDMRKAAGIQPEELTDTSILKDGSYKKKEAANETSSKTDGQANQGRDESNQVAGRMGMTSRASGRGNKTAEGNGDDEDGGRKRHPHAPKKLLDCDRPAPDKKKRSKKKAANKVLSPYSSWNPADGFVWEPTGARPKVTHRGPGGDMNEMQRRMLHMSLRSVGNQPNGGPAGDTGCKKHQGITAHLSHVLSPVTPLPRNSHNVHAVKRLYHDNGVEAHHKVHLEGFPATARGELQSVEGPERMEVDPVDETPPPPAAAPEVDVSPGVCRGEPRDMVAFVGSLQELKVISTEELQGQHRGVLLDPDLMIESREYREGSQFVKVLFLGNGSFGDVYLNRDKNCGKEFVGKRVQLAAFAPNEALVWSLLDHCCIIRLLGLILTDEMVVFLSEYHPGSQTLQKLVDQAVLGQGRAMRLIQQLFIAVVYLHSQHIVHKDIKPDNILALPGDRIKLIDFGLAMRLSTPRHVDDGLKGTECYMAPEIAGGGEYDSRVDVWSSICAFICLINGRPPWAERFKSAPIKIFVIAVKPPPLEDIPVRTDPRVRQWIEQCLKKDFRQRPTAAQALDLLPLECADELYDTRATGDEQETEVEPMMESLGISDNVLAEPVTPWTPRGPEDGFRPFQPLQPGRRDEGPVSDMSLSSFYILSDNEPRNDKHSGEMDVVEADEDMYGPPMDTDGPEVFNERAFQGVDTHAADGGLSDALGRRHSTSAVSGGSVARMRSHGAANFGQPVAGHQAIMFGQQPVCQDAVHGVDGARQNSQATCSFIADEAGGDVSNLSGLSGENSSFELELESPQVSSTECDSWTTAYAQIFNASKMPSGGGSRRYEPDDGGAAGGPAVTSGFDSNSPWDSAEESRGQHLVSQAETVGRANHMPSVGIFVTVNMEGVEPFRMRISSGFTVRQLAKQIILLPNCANSKMMTKMFTLKLRGNGEALDLEHTFSCGEHELVAVVAPDGGDWLWCIDGSGRITVADFA